MTDNLGLSPEFLGRVKLVTSVAGLAGVVIYNRFLKDVPIKSVLKWSTIWGTVLGSTQLILVNHWNEALGLPDKVRRV